MFKVIAIAAALLNGVTGTKSFNYWGRVAVLDKYENALLSH